MSGRGDTGIARTENAALPRILLLGAPYSVVVSDSPDVRERFVRTGMNTGNLLIGNGMVKHLAYACLGVFKEGMSSAQIQENYDLVVIAAANFLHPKFDFRVYSEALETTSLPVVMAGLGAQAPSSGAEMSDIPRGTWRLVEIAAERSVTVGVRGYYTAELLRRRGIANVRVTGCPSLYTSGEAAMRIRRPERIDPSRVAMNGSRNVTQHAGDVEAALKVESMLLAYAMGNRAPFVYQNEEPEIYISQGEEVASQSALAERICGELGVPPAEFVEYARSLGKTFFSVESWFGWIREFDFSCGTRFHGNMAALLSGVPAVVVVHDSRTRELCEFAAIPHVGINDVDEVNPQRWYDAANYDLFEERYNVLLRKYVEFLDENKVAHTLHWAPDLPPRGGLAGRRRG